MRETLIKCPNCGTEIPISEALTTQIRSELEATLQRQNEERLKRAIQEAEARARESSAQETKLLQEQLTEQKCVHVSGFRPIHGRNDDIFC